MKLIVLLTLFWNSDNVMVPMVYAECISQGIKHPEIVTTQAILETGWFSCTDCSYDYNNLFGIIDGDGYKKEKDWRESIKTYKEWQDKWYDGNTPYLEFLNCIYVGVDGKCRRYASSEKYIETVRQILNKHFHNWTE